MTTNTPNTPNTTDSTTVNAEIYAKVYGKLINTVLPAFHEAVDQLAEDKYPDVGDFMINSMAGITATVLRDAIQATSRQTGMPLPKARKRVLKQLNERSNLFVRRMDESENETNNR